MLAVNKKTVSASTDKNTDWHSINWQKCKCPNCMQEISMETGWDIHHIIPKSKGGDNRSSNLMMLHINCHKQIHNPRFIC